MPVGGSHRRRRPAAARRRAGCAARSADFDRRPDAVGYIDPALAARTPNLRRLAQEGVWADGVVGVTPTVTYPSHTTLITGVEPARHGIYDNRILDPENRSNGAWYWYTRAIQVQTLPGAVRGRGLTAAGVTWPVSIGMDLDFNAPEYMGTSRHPEGVQLLAASARRARCSMPRSWPEARRSAGRRPIAIGRTSPASSCAPTRRT